MRKPNGYVIHETPSIVAIATGFERQSENAKTGSMVQIWILVKSENPVAAIASGTDKAICGNCPFRPALGGACYVNVGQAPLEVWNAWNRGSYPMITDYSVFAGRKVRFGAYGDPTRIPFTVLKRIADVSAGWTGYTHQWRNPIYRKYQELLMASCEDGEALRALTEGWRTFRVIGKDSPAIKGERECPSDTHGIKCADCRLCDGTARRSAGVQNIFIRVHGIKAGKFN